MWIREKSLPLLGIDPYTSVVQPIAHCCIDSCSGFTVEARHVKSGMKIDLKYDCTLYMKVFLKDKTTNNSNRPVG
jgi:hypothetical protein